MIALLSPAKRLEFEQECPFAPTVAPLLSETKKLSRVTTRLTAAELARLMKLSRPLSELNAQRFAAFKATPKPAGARPAVWAFDGDTYVGLRAREFSPQEMAFAQDHVAILSGLYGLLRPLDAILPYRLEMGTKLETERGRSLYDFWGDRIAQQLQKQLTSLGADTVVNLASQEYFQAVDLRALDARVIQPVFKEQRGNALKIIGFSAKRARGAMARFLVEQRVEDPERLKKFRADGYRFEKSLSSEDTWVFVRKER